MWIWEEFKPGDYAPEQRIVPPGYQTYGDSLTREDIDQIGLRPELKAVELVGLRQKEFEYFVEKFGRRFEAISLFKCPLISDLTPLERLDKVKYIFIYWNLKASGLWNIGKNQGIKSLILQNFKRIDDLDHAFDGANIEELTFGNHAFSSSGTYCAGSLDFVAKITTLKYLSFDSVRLETPDLTPIAQMPDLMEFEFPVRQFSTEQIAWLAAKMPHLGLNAYSTLDVQNASAGGDEPTVTAYCFIAGKRKPTLTVGKDDKRIEKYVADFRALTEHYKNNPSLPCPRQ